MENRETSEVGIRFPTDGDLVSERDTGSTMMPMADSWCVVSTFLKRLPD